MGKVSGSGELASRNATEIDMLLSLLRVSTTTIYRRDLYII
jgi:hypothetical protein